MSIIIKGMEMPKNCGECFVGNRTICADDCPLIELPPHGRLVDIKSVEDRKFTTVDNEYERWWNGALDSVVDNAPTVIEAEGEKE